jgi:hypothetical protein
MLKRWEVDTERDASRDKEHISTRLIKCLLDETDEKSGGKDAI